LTTRPLGRHSFTYGPVRSRRLGLSLGLNIIPRKTCPLDCIYCQCGRTTRKTVERQSFFPVRDVLAAVRKAVAERKTEFLTFSGEGEPTLNKDIGRIIRALKREYTIPVAVITNSAFLPDPEVRRDLHPADLVMPSLDAADQRTFARVDRCHRNLRVEDIIAGLVSFRRYYRGRLWLEIMLVKGVNDSVEHLVRLRKAVARIRPDRVQLNTVVRPPAEKSARPLSHDDLLQIQALFGPRTDIACAVSRASASVRSAVRHSTAGPLNHSNAIVSLVRGRPVTESDISRSAGLPRSALRPLLTRLRRDGLIRPVRYWGRTFFEAV
jgi:wyosine [tRNA(Phe)-imidazoG37] synthetase (radical SAM superfamily)